MAPLLRGKTALSPRRNVYFCNFALTRQHPRRPNAFRPHLATSGRGAKLFRIAKLSPKSSPCPAACPQKADVNFHSQIAGQIGPPRQTRWVLSIFDEGRNMFSRARQGRFISLAAHLPPREPTSIFARKSQVRLALTLRNPSVFKHSGGLLGHK